MKNRTSIEIDTILPLKKVQDLEIPFYGSLVQAGFPSPADDFIEEFINLNNLLIDNEQSTFFVRCVGHSMIGANVYPGDTLIVDRSLTSKHDDIILAVIDGEVTVKRLYNKNGKVVLKAENPEYKDISIFGDVDCWGVVTYIIHKA